MNRYLLCLPVATLLLSACGDTSVKQTLGIDRRAPDEFRVVSRPPLSVPPQFDLRPPGVDGVGSIATRDRAQSLVLGDQSAKTTTGKTTADSLFLQKAGAADANPNVKQELAEKRINEQLKKEDEGWWDKLSLDNNKKEPVVKAEGEAARIKKNQEEGKPVTEGQTPETGGGTISTLERWFGDW
jgi:hypothetical protein